MALHLLWLESVIKRHHHWSLKLLLLHWLLRKAHCALHIAACSCVNVPLHRHKASILLDASQHLLLIPLVLVENICTGQRGCLIPREQAQSVSSSVICATSSCFSQVVRVVRVKLVVRWLPGRKDHILSLQAVDLVVRRDFQVAALIIGPLFDAIDSVVADGAWIRRDLLTHGRRLYRLVEVAGREALLLRLCQVMECIFDLGLQVG